MPLDAARAVTKIEGINEEFAAIGYANGTTMPRSKANLEPIAWEVFVSKHLAKAAAARAESATRAAIKAGVMFDHKKNPLPDGTNKVVYDGDVVRIDLSVTTGRAGIDHEAFVESLLKAGVEEKLLTRLAKKHATTSAAPHSFTPSLVTAR